MMTFAVGVLVVCMPGDYLIDCSTWGGVTTAEIEFTYVAHGGRTFTGVVEVYEGSSPDVVVDVLTAGLRQKGWRYRELGNGRFVLYGWKDSPMGAVTVSGDGWLPEVTKRVAEK